MNLANDEMQMQVPFLPVNHVNLIDEEIPLDQLVDFNEVNLPEDLMEGQDDQDAGPDQHGPGNGNIQLNVGMVLIQQDGPDLAFADWERRKTTEATRIWATYFSLGNPNSIHVSIPTEWANFFTVMLMSLENFYWAKEFLSPRLHSV